MSNTFVTNNFSEITFGRKSVRQYDETYKIPREEMLEMISRGIYRSFVGQFTALAFYCSRK